MDDARSEGFTLTKQTTVSIGLMIAVIIGLIWLMNFVRTEVSAMQREADRRLEEIIRRLTDTAVEVRVLAVNQAHTQENVSQLISDFREIRHTVHRLEARNLPPAELPERDR